MLNLNQSSTQHPPPRILHDHIEENFKSLAKCRVLHFIHNAKYNEEYRFSHPTDKIGTFVHQMRVELSRLRKEAIKRVQGAAKKKPFKMLQLQNEPGIKPGFSTVVLVKSLNVQQVRFNKELEAAMSGLLDSDAEVL